MRVNRIDDDSGFQEQVYAYTGRFLKVRRYDAGLSGHELGILMSLSQQQVSRYENGQTRMTVDMLMRFFRALRLKPYEVEFFFSGLLEIYKNQSFDLNIRTVFC